MKNLCLPSPRFFSDRDFLRVIGSGCSNSSSTSCCSSDSFISFSLGLRPKVPLLGRLAPFVFDFASSSETGCEIELLCLDTAEGDGEPVRGRLTIGLLLHAHISFHSHYPSHSRFCVRNKERNAYPSSSLRLLFVLRELVSSLSIRFSSLLSSIARLRSSSSS